MGYLKKAKRLLMPPIISNVKYYLKRKDHLYYYGNYSTFEEAEASINVQQGYAAENIIDQVDEATQKVRKGKALYEQDGVCFYKPNYNFELLASLFYVKDKLKKINILDFGGSLGSNYFRYRDIIDSNDMGWCIVEQEHYVKRGKKKVPELNFFYNVDEALSSDLSPNVLLLSGVLQYLNNPYKWFGNLLSKKFDYVIIDETAFLKKRKGTSQIMLQHVPASIYKATYPVTVLGEIEFKKFINECKYEIVWEWIYRGGQIPIKRGIMFEDTIDKGFLLKKKI
ncbi:methyltransferase, TIGR04325 family [Selenomonas sp. FC4001]|uniref:methyltransferase, TIGR04325 family n=1 Tax=Selenomonas sp. FC4001 TaxID=1408313 RepID=UPI0006906CF5|nr:methyltransferase, TIGR04325 family [Selenomonas sp. FC4001]